MINCVFTLDYEIYGNGQGSLRELVYEPAERLRAIFEKWNARFVAFIEVAELEVIEASDTDHAIGIVKDQIRKFHERGFELGLHLHPQWFNARRQDGDWILDYSEYSLCDQSRERIAGVVKRSIEYLRRLAGEIDYSPLSFRAGNWLLQPSQTIAQVLTEQAIKIDSSVFKGGLQHQHKLDYRRALKNGYFWRFTKDVETPDPQGSIIEFPIYTTMVPIWKLLTTKRISLQRKGPSAPQTRGARLNRLLDFCRFRHPIKLDFCRMTIEELTQMLDKEIEKDVKDPGRFRPVVAIGHTKDLIDIKTVESFLSYLRARNIPLATFKDIYDRLGVNTKPDILSKPCE